MSHFEAVEVEIRIFEVVLRIDFSRKNDQKWTSSQASTIVPASCLVNIVVQVPRRIQTFCRCMVGHFLCGACIGIHTASVVDSSWERHVIHCDNQKNNLVSAFTAITFYLEEPWQRFFCFVVGDVTIEPKLPSHFQGSIYDWDKANTRVTELRDMVGQYYGCVCLIAV